MDERDELLGLFADRYRRATLRYFHESTADVATVSDVAAALSESHQEDSQQIAARLHHSTLPKLAEADVLEYDPRSTSVRYCGHSGIDAIVNVLDEL
ncbi:hypothetical protein OB920_03325 [Halobacteria archaeon HArc-gm2]|nr:hypothetical protein [Halobacteria archaeon HArc-gm2]